MDIDRFWQLIDEARAAAGAQADQAIRDYDAVEDDPDKDYWDFNEEDLQAMVDSGRLTLEGDEPDLAQADEFVNGVDGPDGEEGEDDDEDDITDPVALALFQLLTQLSAAEIAAFDNLFEDVRARADDESLANAAMLIEHGFLGDDSFDDFRGGLVALGRTAFDQAMANPDSLADHPLVREIAASHDPRWLGREDMLFVASHAYATVTGEPEINFFEFAEALREVPTGDDGDDEDEKPGQGWTVTDEAETRRRLPRLSELFFERSMRNRRRALEKLGLQA